MTNTPRTNAQPVEYARRDARIKCVNIEFAQELERELDEAVASHKWSDHQVAVFARIADNEKAGRIEAEKEREQWRTMAQDLAKILKATHSLRDCTDDCEIKIRLERFNKLNQ